MIRINDISHHQETCDFKKIKTKSLGVILKAGQGSWVDEKFEEFRNGANQEKVVFGTYWFYDERYEPKDQARLWVETIRNDPGVLGAWLDLEQWEPGPYNTWEHWKECMEEFKVLLPNVNLGVYTRKNYFDGQVGNNYAYFAEHPLWVAYYTTASNPSLPNGWNNWVIWQYSQEGDGKAHGVGSEGIDMDRYNEDEETFKQRFGITNSDNKYRVIADPSLNVREGPDRSYDKKGSVMLNEVVERLDENEDGTWFKIRTTDGTLEGWCSAEYLQINDGLLSEYQTTNPAKGVTRIEGELHGTRFYLTMCNPADVIIKVVHEDGWPSAIAKRTGAKYAFNGDDWLRNTRKVKGTEISNGKVHQKRKSSEPSLIITKSGKAHIDHKNFQGQWNVTSGLRYLVQGGVNKIPPNGTEFKYTERHARSVRGLHADGRVMFLTVDGDYVNSGMTLWEAAELMLEFGCFVAFDGGGGGDSVDVVDGVIASVPDDEGSDGKPVERKVPQTILVFIKESN